MSADHKGIDLAALARPAETIAPPRRGWLRIVLPVAIVAAFLFLLRGSLVEWLRPRLAVTVVRPTRIEGAPVPASGANVDDVTSAGGTANDVQVRQFAPQLAVQAAGWVEADPFPSHVPALAGGVIAELFLQESDHVDAGAVVATMVADDARLEHERAAAVVERARAALATARVRATIARERFDAALEVDEALRKATALRQGREAEVQLRVAAVIEGEAAIALAESEVIVQRELEEAGASGARQVEIAAATLEIARARLATLRAQATYAEAEVEAAAASEARAAGERELRFTDRLERDVAASEVQRLEADLADADGRLAEAALRLDRMSVVAPRAGVVLERFVAPGEALTVGAAVYSMYDPAALRVRVDVPQGDVEKLFVGQAAEVLAESRGGRPYRGELLRIVQRADIQKVTLEAQVRILDADELLRPDMLAQVRFMDTPAGGRAGGLAMGARATSGAEQGDGGGRNPRPVAGPRIAIPSQLATAGHVWVLDATLGVARRRPVELGGELVAESGTARGLVEVLAGLNLTDKVIDRGRLELEQRTDHDAPVPVRVIGAETQANEGSQE